MDEGIEAKIEEVLARIRPSLRATDRLQLKSIEEGVVTVEHCTLLSNPSPSTCHAFSNVHDPQMTDAVILETLEEEFKQVVPGFKEVHLVHAVA